MKKQASLTFLATLACLVVLGWHFSQNSKSQADSQAAPTVLKKAPLTAERPVTVSPPSLAQDLPEQDLPATIDLGESYPTPQGARRLLRRPGWVALQPKEKPNNPNFIAELILPGGALEGYSIQKIWPNQVIELQGPPSAILAEEKDPSLNRRRLAQLRAALPDDLQLASPIHLDDTDQAPLITFGDVIIALKSEESDLTALTTNSSQVRPLPATTDQFILTLKEQSPADLFAEVARLAQHPEVLWAEPDFIIRHEFTSAPNDPLYPQQWHLENNGQAGGVPNADVDAEKAWETSTGSPEIIVAVIDDGFDLQHEDLRPNLFINPGESGNDSSGNPKESNGIDDDNNGFIDDINGWDFNENDNSPGLVERHPFGTGTIFTNASLQDIGIRITEAPGSGADFAYLNNTVTLSIHYNQGFFGIGAGYEFRLFDGDGTPTEVARIVRSATESDVADDKQTLYNTLIALISPLQAADTIFTTPTQSNTAQAHQIKLLASAVFGFPYTLPDHGTAVSGVAIAKQNNAKGVSGIAPNCSWLPIEPGFTGSQFAAAINYCSGFRGINGANRSGADVINMSLSGGGPISNADNTAFNNAFNNGRDGKGMLVFASSGNSASAWISVEVEFGSVDDDPVPSARKFQWRYSKDGSFTGGSDAIWIDDIVIDTQSVRSENFDDNTVPGNYTSSPSNAWTIISDPDRSRGTTNDRSLKTAPLANNSSATYTYENTLTSGKISFKVWVSCDRSDKFEFLLDDEVLFSLSGDTPAASRVWNSVRITPSDLPEEVTIDRPGTYNPNPRPRYAGHPNVMGIGGSTTYDTRVDYAQYGTLTQGLDFVAPTGFSEGNIRTTDNSGTFGYDNGDYTSTFNGTSSSAPLAAGIGALMLSVNPDLDAATARDLLQRSCDFIGGQSYNNDGTGKFRNNYYGYGKLNAAKAVQMGLDSYSFVAPTNLAGTINGVETSFTYDYPYEVTKYILYKNTSPSLVGAGNGGVQSVSTPVADFTTATGNLYYALKVFGPTTGQESALSSWVAVTRPIPAPQNFVASKGRFFDRVAVSWFAVPGIDDYLLTRSKNGGSATNITLPANSTSYTDTDLAPSDTVSYTLVARKGGVTSPSVSDEGFLGEAVSISATQGTVPGAITVTWDPLPNALGGSVFRTDTTSPPMDADNSGRPDQEPLSSFFISGSYTDDTAADGRPYYYWVAGYNADGDLTALSGPALGFTAPTPQHLNAGNSVDETGPDFQWIDISQTGTAILTTGDDASATISLPFGLNFFNDTLFNELSVSSNGYIATTDTDNGADYNNDCPLPTTPDRGDTSSGRIYVYHDDLDLSSIGANVFYQEFFYFPHTHQPVLDLAVPERVAIVQWDNVVRLGETTPFSFQVIIFPNGDLVYQYLPGHPGGGSATIGLQDPAANNALTISCNQTGIIPTNQPYSVLLSAPDSINWLFPTEAIVTTDLDEDDGGLGMGTGDSLREIIFHTSATYVRFAPSLSGKTLTITGDPLITGGRTYDGRDAPGLVISGGGTQRPFRADPTFSASFKNITLADSNAGTEPGGLFNTSHFLSLENVTIRGCRAEGNGGAIATFDNGSTSGTVLLQNVTFSNNFTFGAGGALDLASAERFSIINCTFADNTAISGARGIVFGNNAIGAFRNNIVDNSSAPIGSSTEVTNLPASANMGNNIFFNSTGITAALQPSDFVGSALLEPLTLNDGPIPVHALQPNSPAIDAADPTAPPVDAHQSNRPIDGDLDGLAVADIGAFEATQPSLLVTTSNDTTNPNDNLLSLREAVAQAQTIPDATIGFDINAMGSSACTLSSGPISLNSGNRIKIQANPDAISEANLLAFWRFDINPNEVTIPNEAGLSDSLVREGNAFITSTNTRTGFGSALDADTIIDAARNLSPTNVAPADEITVAAWVRPTSFQGIGGIVGYHENTFTESSGYYLTTTFDDHFDWRITTGDDELTTLRTNSSFSTNQWHFLVGVYDGSELRIYVNGILEGVTEATGAIDYTPTPPSGIQVGRFKTSVSTFAYDGLIDDVMIFDQALSSAEIRTLQGLAPSDGITIDANGNNQSFVVQNSTSATLENLTLTGAVQSGITVAGDSKLTLNDCLITGNTSTSGGGAMRNQGVTSLNRTRVTNNTTTSAFGGGIDNVFGGRLTLNFSTIDNNHATLGNGGGVDNFSNATLVLNHSTISGNTCNGNGGGVYLDGSSSARIFHSTITGNAANGGGDGFFSAGGTVESSHTLFVENDGPDYQGPLVSLGHNLFSDSSQVTITGNLVGNQTSPEAIVSPLLADNGGATPTHALLPNTPAIDGGSNLPAREVTNPSDTFSTSLLTASPPSHPVEQAFDGSSTTTFQAFDSNLLAYWDFNESPSGVLVPDRVGEYIGSLIAGASISAAGTGRSGLSDDTALSITGFSQGFVRSGSSDFLAPVVASDAITVSFWQKRDANPPSGGLSLLIGSSSSSDGNGLSVKSPVDISDQRLEFLTADPTNTNSSLLSPPASAVDWSQWHHIAVVKNGFQREIYLDGSLFATGTGAPALPADLDTLFFAAGLDGLFDDLAIYNGALSASQIQTLATASVPPGQAEINIAPSIGLASVNALQLFVSDSDTASDPATYLLEGSLDNENFDLISEGIVPPFPSRFSSQTLTFPTSAAYSSFRLTFPSNRDPSASPVIEIAEITLLDQPSLDQRSRLRLSDGDGDRIKLADIGAFEAQVYTVDSPLDSTLAEFDPDSLSGNELRSAIQSQDPADFIAFDKTTMDGTVITLDPAKGPLAVNRPLALITDNLPNGLTLSGSGLTEGLLEVATSASFSAEAITLTGSTGQAAILNNGTLNLSRCLLHGNESTTHNGGALMNSGDAFIDNSTFSNNSTTIASGTGGAIFNEGNLSLDFCTLTNNFAFSVGGVANSTGAQTTANHSIISQNSNNSSTNEDFAGTFNSLGYNHLGNSSGITGLDATDNTGNAFLSPLADNGGPTLTHAPRYNSSALDSGSTGGTSYSADQRGFARLFGTQPDRGALEHDPVHLYLGADSDLDTMTDRYEEFYAFNPLSDVDLTLDRDDDGSNTLQEFLARTNPYDDSSFLQVSSTSLSESGKFTLTWDSVPGVTYSVWSSTDLRGDFDPVFGSTTFASSPSTSLTLQMTEPRLFFQIQTGAAPEEEIRELDSDDQP